MILPVLAAIAVRAVVSYAVKEGVEFVANKAKDAAVQALVKKARDYAEKTLIAKAKEKCPDCDPADLLKSMKDPCSLLSEGKGSGKYRGGSHAKMTSAKYTGDKLDSHHIPAKSNYPSWKPSWSKSTKNKVSAKWPAIQMAQNDHANTFSNGNGAKAQAFGRAQKYAFKKFGMLGAFALDAAEIKMKHGSKYDTALKEAGAYTACVAAFPEKYNVNGAKGGKRRRK